MNLSILLALVTTTRALSPRCLEYCWLKFSRQLSLPWHPQCNCSAEENETTPVSKARSVLKLHENGIYYEPAELYSGETESYYDQPFYIVYPIVKVIPKHFKGLKNVNKNNPKRYESKLTREKKTMKHQDDEILLEKLNTRKHFEYLDVNVGRKSIDGRSSGQTSHSSEDLHQMEKILSQCVDLHILSLSRKRNNVSTLLKLWGTTKFQRLNDLSDSDLIKAIENECRKPEKYVTNSLGEIINRWSKRSKTPVANTSNYGRNDDLYLLNRTKPQTIPKNVFLLRNNSDSSDYTSDLKTAETIAKSTDNKTSNQPTAKVMDHRVPAEDVAAHKLKNVKDPVSNSHLGKALSARSADETNNIPVKSDLSFSTVTEGLNITQINEIVVNKNEDKDLSNNTNVSSIQKQIFDIDKKAPVNLGSWEEDKGNTSYSDKSGKFTKEQNYLETFREDLNHHDIRNKSLNIIAPYLISKNHATANQSDLSTGPHNNNSEDIINNTSLGNQKNPMFLSKTYNKDKDKNITIIYAESRKTLFNENEIPLQKIITREFANNTVVSVINGNEDVRNNDFLYSSNDNITSQTSILSLKIEGKSNDTNNDLTEALVKDIEKSVSNKPKSGTESVIRGRLYFLFEQEPIPARFVQKSDGGLHVGIDGQTLCMKLVEEEVNKSKILTALCNCTQFNNCSVTQNRT